MKKFIRSLSIGMITMLLFTGCGIEIRIVNDKEQETLVEESKETIEATEETLETIEEVDESEKIKPTEPVSIPQISIEGEENTIETEENTIETEENTIETEENIIEDENTEELEGDTSESTDDEDISTELSENEQSDTIEGTEEQVEEIEETEETTEVVEIITLSDKWEDMEFLLDEYKLNIPSLMEQLNESGWSMKLSNYSLKAGTRTLCNIDLTNELYTADNTGFKLQVGFINNTDRDLDISLSSIYALQMNVMNGQDFTQSYPSLEMAKGITFGSTYNDIKEAFGEPNDTYKTDKYVIYTYEDGNNTTMKLTVYGNLGLGKIEFKKL